jgi:hypothetical protein
MIVYRLDRPMRWDGWRRPYQLFHPHPCPEGYLDRTPLDRELGQAEDGARFLGWGGSSDGLWITVLPGENADPLLVLGWTEHRVRSFIATPCALPGIDWTCTSKVISEWKRHLPARIVAAQTHEEAA